MNRSLTFKSLIITVLLAMSMGFAPLMAVAVGVDDARIVINIPSRTLWLFSGEEIVKYYSVGVGRPGFQTPTGKFQVIRKILHPGWENPYLGKGAVKIPPGSRNPLGTRWIGFKEYKGGEYGIHGTDNPSSVGKYSSHGCVRMRVADAEDLFEKVDVGTPVEVIYDVALIRRHENQIRLIVFPDTFKKGRPSPEEMVKRIQEQYPEAQVDSTRISEALRQATQQPVVVALLQEKS